MVAFANCKYKILRSSSWSSPLHIIGDETRCGASKVRQAHSVRPKTYSVTMQMDAANAEIFKEWFANTDWYGFYSFPLPQIDVVNGAPKEYRFKPDTELSWSNTAGQILNVSFDLEEIP